MVFTFGIEEEFLLMDTRTGFPTGARAARRALASPRHSGFSTSAELLDAQVESSTRVCTTRREALDALLGFRSRLAEAAAAAGVLVAATGAAPRIPDSPPVINSSARYRRMGSLAGAVAHEQYVNGTHIHVGIPSRDVGVRVLNGLRPWLALLGAVAANSPYWRGQDSSFASWRMVHYRRWSVQGCPPVFADAEDYARRLAGLLATDVVPDAGHVGWAARLSENFPTVEVRIADAQLQAQDSLLLAVLVRALVDKLASVPTAGPAAGRAADPELLDVGLWQAARFGMGGNLVSHPGGSVPAAEHLAALLDFVAPALDDAGDGDFVAAGISRLLNTGTGAEQQRAAFGSGGYPALTDLYTRSLTAE
ncbi:MULTISPECIES: glutamate--cysteine ligase [unclassified Arthrobacter]|uniref:carboxylate-amine ligase n=1 Tax=unclassified Arthrobacter TaxID=235627 RepID=UPI001E4D2C8B|nr:MULTISPECIES: glutamate--cysteine ligase [unclassified Arthrobacter]MCC9146493.1 glutamate--cysteine ligase [Arthrobacter sp. zg-Y919]MDK1277723.1 glutamate--cysteine ligase [Arthrobacter sp. zg.Y919]WIB02321.1 glutamate--cysteine ligase [Arthrobacter sp. zg-Y919]